MIPHTYIHKQHTFERVRERMLASLRKFHHGIVRRLIRCLNVFFVVPGTSMQQLEQPDQWVICNCTQDTTPYRRDTMMNPQIHAEEQLNIATHMETVVPEGNRLVQCGFNPEEIVALLRLRQWYQMGGSDRIQVVHHWQFLKLLVRNGKMEV